ncbi:MAG: C40 family peptidase [Nocardiopsaceae bacterium]|nr:C40 family peptidase [Nocardiopsaceae bacterium]
MAPRSRAARLGLAAVFCGALVISVLPALSNPAEAAPAATTGPGADASVEYVDVSVATVWTSPDKPRPVDHDALANPVDIPGWIKAMSPRQQEELTDDNMTQTQALYGQAVHVLARGEGWTKVAVTGQPTPKNALGYPGWIPDDQLTSNPAYGVAQARRPFALVDRGLSDWLYDDPALVRKQLRLSVNTRLPVLGRTRQALLVDTPDHGPRWLPTASATEYRSDADIPAPTGADLVRTARTFLGQPYLWGGRSSWGMDCSGLTGLAYQLHGITIPRDSGPQALDGGATRVSRDDLRPGDLIFYSSDGPGGDADSIYHVAMYAGHGDMIEAYDHKTPVRITPVRYNADYWGAVRYINS